MSKYQMLVQETFRAITANHPQTPRFLQQFLFNLFQNTNTIKETSQIHTQIIINNFTQKNFIIVKLLQSYLRSGYLHQAHQTFSQINNPSITSWNQIITAFAGTDTPVKSVNLFDEMLVSGVKPDEYSYSYVISACARGKLIRLGEKLHGRVLASGFGSNLFVETNLVNLYGDVGDVKNARKVFDEMCERNVVTWNTLISGYVKCGDVEVARKLFDEMPERNIVSWTTLVSGYANNGGCKEALSLVRVMLKSSMGLDQVTLVAALSACVEIGDLKMGKWIHSYVDRNWHISNKNRTVRLNNALLHMYAGCGVIDDAYELFKRMQLKSTVSWTTMISGFAKHGRGKEALTVFECMKNKQDDGSKPDAVTLLVVLYACSHSGLVDQGREIFKNMKIWGVDPQIEHYGCMVDLLSRAGLLDEACKLIETMPMDPNDAIWGALLGGCRIYKNVNLAAEVGQKLGNLDVGDDKAAAYLVLLSNVYAGAKRWKEVAYTREKMVELDLKKAPGRSCLQIGGSVHEFLAGDWSHKHECLIYEMLVLVTVEARLSGYKPDVYQTVEGFVGK